MTYPEVDRIKEGLGSILIAFAADKPNDNHEHRLILENRNEPTIAAYRVNCLTPDDPDIRVVTQHRNYEQSRYELDYLQGGDCVGILSLEWWRGGRVWAGFLATLLIGRLLFLLPKRRSML